MKSTLKLTLLASLVGVTTAAQAVNIVSWGGAYSKSQLLAYHEPYMANNPDVLIINDESSPEAVAKLAARVAAFCSPASSGAIFT